MANQSNYVINVLAKGAKKTQQQLKGVNGSLTSMAGKVAGVAAAYFAAQGLINGAMSAANAYARQEQAEKKLRFALGSNTQALLNQASALQQVTTFGDEAIIEQQAFLASLKFSEDQIKSIIPVALDLAEATGISLESAVRNTSKTFSGLAGELGELVPQLRDLTKEEMMAGDAVKVMADLFQGQAQVGAETFGGKMKQLTNTLGDLAEAAGELLVPVILPLANGLKIAAEGTLSFFKTLGVIGDEGSEQIKKVTANFDFFNQSIKDNKELQKTLTEEMKNGTGGQRQVLAARLKQMQEQHDADVQHRDDLIKALEAESVVSAATKGKFDTTVKLSKVESNLDIDRQIRHKKEMKRKLEDAALSGQTAKQAAKSVIKTESMEAIAGLISSIFKSVPFPLNTILAAGAGTAASSIIDKQLSKFEQGGVVGGRRHSQGGTIIEAEQGEFVMSRDAVSRIGVNNLNAMNQGGSGTTINISAPLLDDTIVDSIIPKIEEAVRRGSDLGV